MNRHVLRPRIPPTPNLVEEIEKHVREQQGNEGERESGDAEISPGFADGPFILQYDGFGRELLKKSNERFAGTEAEIPMRADGEVENMHMLKRLALITTIYQDRQLQSAGVLPITPLQSEDLLQQGKLPKLGSYWEVLGLVLYDRDTSGTNIHEARTLHRCLRKYRQDLGLSASDLREKLLIVNAGLEKDDSMPRRVKPVVLPGLTEVYAPDVLNYSQGFCRFEYGLQAGLPGMNDIGKGSRTIYLPGDKGDIGLRVLYRGDDLVLLAHAKDLDGCGVGGRAVFASQSAGN